jgi:protease-4
MPEKPSNRLLWIVVGGAGLLFTALLLITLIFLLADSGAPSLSLTSNQVLVLDVEGIILDSSDFVEQLNEYGNRPSVRGVLLHLNTPGGGVAASQEIYEAIRKFRARTHKKVVASMSSVAASGGYYIACAADRIFANPGTITGSIGVVAEWLNYGELLRWAKVESIVIKSGALKDAGSPTRRLTDPEKAYFQTLIDGMYGQFVGAVASSRKMDPLAVRKLADGRVYTGQEAKDNGLIDEIGTYEDALSAAGKMAGIRGEPKPFKPEKKHFSLLDALLGQTRSSVLGNLERSESQIRFQYLWR